MKIKDIRTKKKKKKEEAENGVCVDGEISILVAWSLCYFACQSRSHVLKIRPRSLFSRGKALSGVLFACLNMYVCICVYCTNNVHLHLKKVLGEKILLHTPD